MCYKCNEEHKHLVILVAAKTDRSLITDEVLDWLIEHIEEAYADRMDRVD